MYIKRLKETSTVRPYVVFICSFAALFLLYLPAMRAGFAGDYFKDWLQVIQNESFADYINRPGTATLYQFTQFITYIIYKLIGSSRTGWHFVHLSVHALNATLLYVFARGITTDHRISGSTLIAVMVTALFIVTPYNSEVVVHEPCFHYTTGLAFLLLSLLCTRRYLQTGKQQFILYIVLLFLPAAFSLEIFYLTPLMVLLLGAHYCYISGFERQRFKTLFILGFIPMIVVFLAHIVLVHYVVNAALPHDVPASASGLLQLYTEKVLKYLFHIILLGRFWPEAAKNSVYALCQNEIFVWTIHIALLIFILYSFFSTKAGNKIKLAAPLLIFAWLCIALVTPRSFPGSQLVVFDRYHYFALPFLYLLLAVLFFSQRYIKLYLALGGMLVCINIYFLVYVNRQWQQSNYITEHLLTSFPAAGDKAVLLLNTPENFNGIPMIGSNRPSALATAYNTKHEHKLAHPVFDIASFNMTTSTDGAHVRVLNDSTVQVTLNQWGTWWWFHYVGAQDYENEYYRVKITDPGHWYELHLKQPAERYTILFVTGPDWKVVDMSRKDVDQY